MKSYPLSDLEPGTEFDAVLLSPEGFRLAPSNTRLTRERLDRLREWGIEAVEAEAEPQLPDTAEDGSAEGERDRGTPDEGIASIPPVDRNVPPDYTPEKKFRVEEGYRKALTQTRTLLSRLARATVQKRMDLLKPLQPLYPLMDEMPQLLFIHVADRNRVEPDQDYIFPYSLNTAIVSMILGWGFDLDAREIHRLGAGALVHDVGMLKIPAFLRQTNRDLSEEDRRKIRSHTERGSDVVSTIDHMWRPVIRVVREHHIQMDGTGYPDKDPEETHLYARIVNLSMSFIAVTQPRPYRSGMSFHHGARRVLEDQNQRYDEDVLGVFREWIGLYPPGSLIRLDTGELALTLRPADPRGERPLVYVLTTPDGSRRTEPLLRNLGDDTERAVQGVVGNRSGYSAMDLI